ncbi:MAG TPA: efflux RND transporter permease subunit [Candidatus Baltobacteraceae bacterium]|nr:efflux RND transporter permease subunit [Candidatus Baltobacteraceae bacterium]
MNVCELFIRRPVMTTLLMAAILIFGFMGYRSLPVSDLPNVDFPTIQVTGRLPGASPENMAASIATPLEKQFSTIAGIDSMTSTSVQGATRVTMTFALERNIDAASQDVQAAIAAAQRQLPANMPSPPTVQKVNPADAPILYLALSSPTLPLYQVDEFAETMLAQRISMVSGVSQVLVFGAQKYAVRVQVDPNKLAARGIGIDEVENALVQGNVNLPTGNLDGRHQTFSVEANGQLYDAAAYSPLVVAYRNGSPVRLGELGTVLDSVENDKVAGWRGTDRAIVLAIQRQPGTNTVKVVDAIQALLPSFRVQLPAAVSLNTLYDRSQTIRASVNDVQFTLLLTICLVVLVIFLFLRNLSATVIPSLALPISVVGTFAVMFAFGYSLDNLSLMALTLSVGFVVDDAIVMLENIVRHMEGGERAFEASLIGSREVGFTVISMTLSLAAVFIPVLFMGGIVGRLFREFAVTVSAAIIVSGFTSLTLTPMLCSRFLRPPAEAHHGRIYAVSERFFQGMLSTYRWTLERCLEHRPTVMLVSATLLVLTGVLFWVMPKGFIPSEDAGQIIGFTEGAQDISFDNMATHQREVAAIIAQDPNIESFMSSVGSGGPNATGNVGRLGLMLKPRSQRKLSADEIIQSLRPKLAKIPGIRVFLQVPPSIRVGGQITKSLYQYTLQGGDVDELYRVSQDVLAKVAALPGLQDVNSDLQITSPKVRVDIDRDKASALGVTAGQIENALYDAYGTRQVSTIYTASNQYMVILELADEYQADPAALLMLYVRSSKGQLVPLSAVAKLVPGVGPLTVNHMGQLPSVTISFDLKPGVALGDAVAQIQRIGRAIIPATMSASFQGSAQAFQSSLEGMGLLLVLAVLVIYIVLGILYESFIHPLTILSGLPAAGVGALLTLLVFGHDLNIYAFVGIIMLVGIVKKNAIMMIDFALQAEARGKAPAEAIFEGCLLRFRPIMMTTMAALMGTLPIALGAGQGAEARRPLGLAVVGGLLVSQMLTLYITPVMYIYLDSFSRWLRSRRWSAVRHAEREPSIGAPTRHGVTGD